MTDPNTLIRTAFQSFKRGDELRSALMSTKSLPPILLQRSFGTIDSDGETITLLKNEPGAAKEPIRFEYPLPGKGFEEKSSFYRTVAQNLLTKTTTIDAYYGTDTQDAPRSSHHSKLKTRKISQLKIGTESLPH